MDSSLRDVWTAAESSPFLPAVSKQHQFKIGFGLLLLGLLLSGFFALSRLDTERLFASARDGRELVQRWEYATRSIKETD